ncbi:butyrophilin subfamily 2 member A2-like [Grus americana]|uniref:butyrophilin subfamily 2 member A2-like n=1 Tax=Grus americana TaxID=9117 RepID=UPI00240847E2|nr:butyrophilin subfamily 2 member A2-like [Grus americana]
MGRDQAGKEPFPEEQTAELMAWRKFLLPHHPDVVTLDPNSAHPELVLSADGRSVRRGRARQDLPDTPERFDTRCCVLGQEALFNGETIRPWFWVETEETQLCLRDCTS